MYPWYKGLIHELKRYTGVGGAGVKGANIEGVSLRHQIDGSKVLTRKPLSLSISRKLPSTGSVFSGEDDGSFTP